MASDNGITVGQLTEALNDKADRDLQNMTANIDYVVESKAPTADDPTWYRKYKSGWVEQGGTVSSNPNADTTLTFLEKFIDTNYTFTACHEKGTGYTNGANVNYFNKNAASIKVYQCDGTGFSWYACGQGAE